MNRSHRIVRFATIGTAGLLAVAACSSSKSGSSSPPTAAGGGSTTTAVSNDWALQYTGGSAGKADASLSPVVIGYVNQEGTVPDYPEATSGIDAAVQYVNAELGGIGGHPVQLEKCVIQAESDGQKCGTQFLNDPKVTLVITGAADRGTQSLYTVLAGKKPVLVSNPLTTPDYVTAGVTAYTPGAPGVVDGMAVYVAKFLPNVKKVAVLYGDNAAEVFGATGLFKPMAKKQGLSDSNIILVPVSDTAQSAEIQQAIQNAGADKADVLVPLINVQLCSAVYDALQSLGINPTVVTSGLCYGTPVTKHMQDIGSKDMVPNNWYFGDYGYSYFTPDAASGMTTYIAKVHQYQGPNVQYTGFAGPVFANLLTAVKFYNKIGLDKVTTASLQSTMQDFKGPMMLVVGPMNCGHFPNTLFKSLCGAQMGIQQYKNPNWVPVMNGLNGNPIDITKY